jgi:phage terminase large subunit-like protein
MSAVAWIESRSGMRLRAWQVATVEAMFPPDGSPSPYETFLISTIKKAGKTSLNAWCMLYAALTFPAPETAYAIANDRGQAEENIFSLIVAAVKEAGLERSGAATIKADRIVFENGTRIIALPMDFAGSAGARFGISSWTELWAFRYEQHIRLWEELTPIPNRRSLRIVDSYAGFTGDAAVLEPLWARALAGERLHEELPIFGNGRLWAYVDQGPDAQARCWLGEPGEMEAYYAEQRASLRPGTYKRLHLNQWQTGAEAFVTAEAWDACVREDVPARMRRGTIVAGVDAATKKDSMAVVVVARDGEQVRLVTHRVWSPRPGAPLDLEETVEAYVRELHREFQLASVYYDPYQLARSAKTLEKMGLPMHEFPQTSGNLTAAAQGLYDLIRERRLVVPAGADELREHVLNAVAVDSGRGWRLAKEKSSRKIDAAAALSFACLAALREEQHGPPTSTSHHPWGRSPSRRRNSTSLRFTRAPNTPTGWNEH